jgi:Glu-tRNA(Gln) amidotransferase subunit E-like FAD-binding protein
MIEDDLSRVEESATKSTYKLDVGFERCKDKDERSCHTRFLRPKPDAHRMYAQDQVVIHTVRM